MRTATVTDEPVPVFLLLADVIDRTKLSKSEIYRRIEANTFPGSIRLSHKRAVWVEHQVVAWMREQVVAA